MVWVKGLIPKIASFLWVTILNRIHTIDNLWNKGLIIPNRYILCKNHEESVDHIFLHCEFACQIWDLTNTRLNNHWVRPQTIAQAIEQWRLNSKSTKEKHIWALIPPHICWAIWGERNTRIFNESCQNTEKTWLKSQHFLLENINHCIIVNPKDHSEASTLINALLLGAISDATFDLIRSSQYLCWHALHQF